MGAIRKMMSISTAGLVDYRSDKERIALYTKGARQEARKQTRIMRRQARREKREAAQPQPVQQAVTGPPVWPAGWYPDAQDAALWRWWDGQQWTERTAPR